MDRTCNRSIFARLAPPVAVPLTSWCVLSIGLLSLAEVASSAVIHVPADQPTIQAGLDAAAEGDTVVVAPGTYAGPGNCGIDFGGRDLVLESSGGAAETIVQGPFDPFDSCPRGIIFQGSESAAAVVEGFTIRGFDVMPDALATGGPALLIAEGAAPTIRDCIFEGNQCTDCQGGAVSAAGGTFERCTFTGNFAVGWNARGSGGAIACRNSTLIDCLIRQNFAVESEFAPSTGGGVACGPLTTLIRCAITENSASVGGGVSVATDSSGPLEVWIAESTIADNEAWQGGAALSATSARAQQQSMYLQQTILWSDGECGPNDVQSFEEVAGSLRMSFICCDVDRDRVVGSADFRFDPHTIGVDPLFCDPRGCGGPIGAGNYRLSPESPCRAENSPCGALLGAFGGPCDEVSAASEAGPRPRVQFLEAPRPNPARERVRCSLEVSVSSRVRVEILDVSGARVADMAGGTMAAGTHELSWDLRDRDGRSVPAGVYWVRVVTDQGAEARPIVVSR